MSYEQQEMDRLAAIIHMLGLLYDVPKRKLKQIYGVVEGMECSGAHEGLYDILDGGEEE